MLAAHFLAGLGVTGLLLGALAHLKRANGAAHGAAVFGFGADQAGKFPVPDGDVMQRGCGGNRSPQFLHTGSPLLQRVFGRAYFSPAALFF